VCKHSNSKGLGPARYYHASTPPGCTITAARGAAATRLSRHDRVTEGDPVPGEDLRALQCRQHVLIKDGPGKLLLE
jgi:hypothetical protein